MYLKLNNKQNLYFTFIRECQLLNLVWIEPNGIISQELIFKQMREYACYRINTWFYFYFLWWYFDACKILNITIINLHKRLIYPYTPVIQSVDLCVYYISRFIYVLKIAVCKEQNININVYSVATPFYNKF